MADSTCLIHGFSYASAIPNESKQGNPMHVLGESISFGRFMNESLSWERWSTFSPHKKYVEEAQRYAQPGSVAQKKVFFEAHYKKIAAQKAAALLEQENASKSELREEADEPSDAVSGLPQHTVALGICLNVDVKSEVAETKVVVNEDANRSIYVEKLNSAEGSVCTVVRDDKPLQEGPAKNDSVNHSKNLDKRDSISVSESSETASQMERPLLKNSAAKEDDEEDDATSAPRKKRTSFSSLRSSIQRKTWRVPPSTPVSMDGVVDNKDANRPIHVEKLAFSEGSGTIIGDDKPLQESPGKNNSINRSKDIGKMDLISSSGTTSQIERPLLKNSVAKADDEEDDATSAPSKKRTSFSSLRSSIQRRTWRAPPSTPVNLVTAHSKKENDLKQQALKLGVVDFITGENASSPKSLGSLISSLPTKDRDKELITASTKQTQSSGLLRSSYRVPTKDHPTPLRTPLAGSKISSEHAAATPQTKNKRLQTPANPSAAGGKTGPKRHIFSAIYSKSLSACRNKLQSPTLSSPFTLRTEERAAKRKQKLEEKFNASEAQRVQQQKTLKNKAGDEIRKLGCGFCFKARPLPDFYKEREPPKSHHLKKIEATTSQPSIPVTANKRKGNASMPPPPPPPSVSAKNSVVAASKHVPIKSLTTANYTLGERIAHENESPNIQL